MLAARNGIFDFGYTLLYDFLIFLVDYVKGKLICDVLFLLYSVWICFMVADLVLGIEKSDLSLPNSILYLLTSCVLGQMVWICVDSIWDWILKYMHITTEASRIMFIFFQ